MTSQGTIITRGITDSESHKRQLVEPDREFGKLLYNTSTVELYGPITEVIFQGVGSAFTLDHTPNGNLDGTAVLDLAAKDTAVVQARVPPITGINYDFRDWLDTSRFLDAGNTTASLDTSAHTITFTDGEVLTSSTVFDNNATVTSATLVTAGNVSASVAGITTHSTLPTGLECYYSFEGGVTDELGNHNGTNNGAVLTASGLIASAYTFGGSDYVDTNYTPAANTNALSVNVWGKSSDTSTWNSIVRNADSSGNGSEQFGMFLRMTTGFVTFAVITRTGGGPEPAVTITGDVDLADGEWHMYTLTFGSGVVTAYVDGTELGSGASAGTLSFSQAFDIGATNDNGSHSNPFIGDLDETGFWTKELTQTEITSLYNSGAGLKYSGAVLTYELSADGGSNYEGSTLNAAHTFTNTGEDLRYRVTSAGSNTITIIGTSDETPIKLITPT